MKFRPMNYGQVAMKRIGNSLISALNLILEPCQSTSDALRFEDINHGYGFVLYTTTLQSAGKLLKTNGIADYGYVFVNNVFQVGLRPRRDAKGTNFRV